MSSETTNIFIFLGTEGHPQENWFPWLKQQLEGKSYNVIVPQFPSPPVVKDPKPHTPCLKLAAA